MIYMYKLLIPNIIVLLNAFLFLMLSIKTVSLRLCIFINVFVLLIAILSEFYILNSFMQVSLFNNMLNISKTGIYMNILMMFFSILTSLASYYYFKNQNFYKTEFFALINFSLFCLMLLFDSNELLTTFIAIEAASICIYALVGFRTNDIIASEAMLKYFLLGSFIGAFYIMGVALIFSELGTTYIDALTGLSYNELINRPILLIGIIFIFSTVLFKLAVFGFYNWNIDTYFGANLPTTSFVSTVFKVASFALFIKLIFISMKDIKDVWQPILYFITIFTMFAGNLSAIKQDNVKKMLIASSIVHTGYILIPFSTSKDLYFNDISTSLFYIFSYAFVLMGAFTILNFISNNKESNLKFENFKGLARTNPVLCFSLSIFILSFIGFPYTIGFIAKFQIFYFAMNNGHLELALIGIVNTIISIYYYLKLVIYIYFYEPKSLDFDFSLKFYIRLMIICFTIFVILGGLGFFSIDYIRDYFL